MLQDLRLRALLGFSRISLFALEAFTGQLRTLQVIAPQELIGRESDPGLPDIEATLCTPTGRARAGVLLFHGIGERIAYWRRAQQLLAAKGIASLIFQYPGYGKTRGAATGARLRTVSLAAYSAFGSILPDSTPVFLLGLSLGTAIAADAAPHLSPAPDGMILAQPFCSLREAARCVIHSRIAAKFAPDIYRLEEALARTSIPTLLHHATGDRLFPYDSTRKVFARVNAPHITLATPEGHTHNSLFVERHPNNWRPIFDFIDHNLASKTR